MQLHVLVVCEGSEGPMLSFGLQPHLFAVASLHWSCMWHATI
jgi:hypothetical protein